MGENVIHGYALLSIGATVLAGILLQESLGAQMVLSGLGFAFFMAGVMVVSTDSGNDERRQTTVSGYLRTAGSVVVLLSMGLPYLPLPIEPVSTRTAYSFVGLVHEMWLGTEVAGALSLLIFASVVFAGAAASLLHYTGGYVVLFGVTGYTHIVSLLIDKGVFNVFLTEFRVGVYVATAGGLLVVLSSLLRGEKERGGATEFIHESYRYRNKSPNR